MEQRCQGGKVQKQKREERRDALENRERLLQTADALFTARGVEAVTMTDIAKEAGVGQGTLYRHFEHKGVVCEALLTSVFERFEIESAANFGYDEATTNPLQLVQIFLVRYTQLIEEHTAYLQGVYTSYQTQGGAGFYQCDSHQAHRERIKHYVQHAISLGICCPDLDSEWLADALLATVQVDLYLYQRHTLGWSVERILAGLAPLVTGLSLLSKTV